MGKRWKRRQDLDITPLDTTPNEQVAKPKMIEFSIAPYQVQTTNYQSHYTAKKTMSVEDYEAYLVLAAMRGYKVGVRVGTNYGGKATITNIKNKGCAIDIWGDKVIPDAFLITCDSNPGHENGCGYNESELTPL